MTPSTISNDETGSSLHREEAHKWNQAKDGVVCTMHRNCSSFI
jgi:hypothetical protein